MAPKVGRRPAVGPRMPRVRHRPAAAAEEVRGRSLSETGGFQWEI